VPLRFHWSLSQAGDRWRKASAPEKQSGVPDLAAHVELCRAAERHGIDSLLLAFSFARPDPLVMASALAALTDSITLMVACRSGVFLPATFVQQVNTASTLAPGRISINVVAGHSPHEQAYYGDFLPHDERYRRTAEFLDVCTALWRRQEEVEYQGRYYHVEKGRLGTPFLAAARTRPEIFVSGNSAPAEDLARCYGDCLLRYPEAPARLRDRVRPLVEAGKEVGLRLALIGRATAEEARRDAGRLLDAAQEKAGAARREFVGRTDSVAFRSTLAAAEAPESEWLTPVLWNGLVPYLGEVCLVGSADEIAAALLEFRDAGIRQFLFSGWPDEEEMAFFGTEVLPRVRALEGADAPPDAQTATRSSATA
jgi:alkanesulfonate monooxygenase